MTHATVKAEYREKLRVKHLAMEPSLQGKVMSFCLDDHAVKIRLPVLPEAEPKCFEDTEAEADTWDKHGNIHAVYIYALLVVIAELSFTIPMVAAKHKHVNTGLFSSAEAKELDHRSDALYFMARRAVDVWIRIARWKTGMGLLDVDYRPDGSSYNGGRLYNLQHGGAFYSPRIGRTAVVPPRTVLTPETWQAISDALIFGDTPPVWNEYFASAQRRLEVADFRECIIDLAITAEAVVRRFPLLQNKKRQPRFSKILENWDRSGFPTAGQCLKDIKQLVAIRNDIMHRGDDAQVDRHLCDRSMGAVKCFISLLT